jgi:hypothetical protein
MFKILEPILSWLLDYFLIEVILQPLFLGISESAIDGTIYSALRVDVIYPVMRSVGFAILILIVMWQAFKSMFSIAGVEADDPARIIFKALVMGFALGFSMEILMWGTELAVGIIELIFGSMGASAIDWSFEGVLKSYTTRVVLNMTGVSILNKIVKIYVIFKVLGGYL